MMQMSKEFGSTVRAEITEFKNRAFYPFLKNIQV